MHVTAMRGLAVIVVLLAALSGAQAATPAATATPAPQGTPTPTGTRAAGEVLIAIDSLVAARGATSFTTNFDAFAAGTFAENLNVSGMTFTPDPPGSWQIADAVAQPFGAPFQLLTGEVLVQNTPGTLVIGLALPVTTFSCNFAVNQPRGASGITAQTFSGTTQVGSISQLSTVGTAVGEGTINVNSATVFDKVRLLALASTATPTATPTTGSGSGSHDPTRTGTPNLTPNAPGTTAGTGGNGCAITTPDSPLPLLLLAVPLLIVAKRYRRGARRGR